MKKLLPIAVAAAAMVAHRASKLSIIERLPSSTALATSPSAFPANALPWRLRQLPCMIKRIDGEKA